MSENLDRYTKKANQVYDEGWQLWSAKPEGPWEPAEVLEYVRNQEQQFQRIGTAPEPMTGYFRPGHDPKAQKLTIEEATLVAAPGVEPGFSPFGYLIAADGTVYALTKQWTHGVCAAILFPELAQRTGFCAPIAPIRENDVYLYQAFELDNGHELPLIRVACGGFLNNYNVSKHFGPAAPAAIEGLRLAFKAMGLSRDETVHTSHGDFTPAKVLKHMGKEFS